MTETAATTLDPQAIHEPRALPMGVKEFHEWSERIISGALVPGATEDSLKFALAEMIMHMPPTESHQADIVFIHRLRKGAANQVAFQMMHELKKKRDDLKRIEELAAEEVIAERKLKADQQAKLSADIPSETLPA